MIVKNDVEAQNQTRKKIFAVESENTAAKRVLFLGNSITLHGEKPEIGWNHNWGMAASAKEKDYVHIVLKELQKRYGDISYAIANVGEWEQNYWKDEVLEKFEDARSFRADTIVFRFGENIRCEHFDNHPLEGYLRRFVKYFEGDAKKIVVTDCFWEHEYICGALKRIADENDYDFVSLSDLGYDDKYMAKGLFEHPGVAAHPGDLGMQKIAERILEKL